MLDESTADSSVPLSPPHPIELSTNLTLNELKMKIRKWLGLEQSEKEVIKLRLADQTLVPLTFLLEGTTQEKYAIFIIIDQWVVTTQGVAEKSLGVGKILRNSYVE